MQLLLRCREAMMRGRLVVSDTVLMVGRLALWAAAFVTAFQGQMLLQDRRHLGRAVVYMAVATVFVVAATWRQRIEGGDEGVEPEKTGRAGPLLRRLRPNAVPLALLVVALGLGFAFRLYRLPTEPFGIWFDEAQNGIMADRIIHDADYRPVFITEYTGTDRPALPVYVFAAGVKLLGRDILALRSVSTLAGLLTLGALFFLARELFDLRIAALATFFLAVMRWHVNFSRVAMEPIWAPFFAVAALLFLVRGVRRGRWYDFALSGLLLGLGLHFYWAFLLMPVLYVVYTAHSFLARRSAPLVPLAVGAVLVALVGFLAYSPVAIYGIQHPDEYMRRASTVSISKGKDLGETIEALKINTRLHVLMFNSTGDFNGRHNLPGEPMLDTFTGIFFVLGLGMSLARAWQPRHLLLLAWVVVGLQPAIWSDGPPQALRSILVVPAVALLAALPLGALWATVARQRGATAEGLADEDSLWRKAVRAVRTDPTGHAARVLVGLTALFFLAQVGRLNFDTYFNKQLNNTAVWFAFSAAPTITGHEIDRLEPEGDQFLVSTSFVNDPARIFLTGGDAEGIAPFDAGRQIPVRELRPTTVLLDSEERPHFLRLESLYPDGEFIEHRPPAGGDVAVYEAILDTDDIRSLMGIRAVYTGADGQRLERQESQIDADWSEGAPLTPPFQTSWSGYIVMPDYGEYVLGLRVPGHARILLDGEFFAEGDGTLEGHALLFQGPHRIEIEADIQEKGVVQLYRARPNGQTMEAVPSTDLFSSPSVYWGLHASYWDGVGFSGSPALERLDPFVAFRYGGDLPVGGAFSARWNGKLLVPTSGTYGMRLFTIGEGRVLINGTQVVASAPQRTGEVRVPLTAGPHDIEVFFSNSTGGAQIFLSWQPPGGEWATVPAQYFAPR